MNILILKDKHEFRRAEGWRLFHAHLAGHWVGEEFLVRKDRMYGIVGKMLTSEQLTDHINKMLEEV